MAKRRKKPEIKWEVEVIRDTNPRPLPKDLRDFVVRVLADALVADMRATQHGPQPEAEERKPK